MNCWGMLNAPCERAKGKRARTFRSEPFDAVLNIQGDEPAMHPGTISALVHLMAEHPELLESRRDAEAGSLPGE